MSVLDGIPVLFLQYKTYGAGVCCSHPNPNRGYPVKKVHSMRRIKTADGGGSSSQWILLFKSQRGFSLNVFNTSSQSNASLDVGNNMG